MFEKLIKSSLENKLIVLLAAILLFITGLIIATRLPVDVFPDLTAPTVTILTEAHGMAPEEVETLVTFPIETAVNGATGVRRVRSSSAAGISIVWVEFDWGTDIFIARQIVNEKLQIAGASLPEGIDRPILAPISSIMGEIMLISVTRDSSMASNGQAVNEMELRSIADWTLRRRLLSVAGVSQVVPIGGEVKQYQILVSPEKLAAYDISLNEVLHAAEQSNTNSSGGVYMDSGQEYLIRGVGRVQKLEDIANSVITTRGDLPVLMRDVAEVKIGPAVKLGDGSANAQPAVIVMVQKQPNANTLKLTERIEQTIEDIRQTLPADVIINTHVFRQADFIRVAIDNVIEALWHGAVLVVIVLLLFLGNLRTTFISAVAIPLSLIVTIFVFRAFSITINTMTLGGMAIAIGVLVDDAIIYVENVFRRLKENNLQPESQRRPTLEVIFDASNEIRSPMVNATLIVVIVFVPLFFLSGVEGRLLRPLGYAYIVSVFASLLVAVTVTPVLSAYLLPNATFMTKEGDSWLVTRLKNAFRKTLDVVLRFPRLVIVTSAVALGLTLLILPFLGRAFLPEFNEGSLTISVLTVPGTSLKESNKIGKLAEEILLEHPEIKSTARRTGRAELDEHAQGVNAAELDARFELNGKSKETFLEELRSALSILPGTNITIGQPIGHRIDHMLSGTRANIAIKIFGPDLYRLRSLAEQVRQQMEPVAGVVDLAVEQQVDVPQVRIKFNRRSMATYGVPVGELAEAVDVAFKGEVVSQILEGQRSYDLLVRFNEQNRGNIEHIRNALFDTPLGPKVPLSQLAEVVYEKGPNTISRENVQRKIVVQANVSGRDLRSVIDDIQRRLDENVTFPQGYHVEYGGQFESEQAATRLLTLLSIVSIAAIFLLLYLEFGSFRSASLIMVNLPLALIGGIWAVFFTDGIVSIASLVGFITLFGIATRNGILMISHYTHLLEEGKAFKDAIIQGSLERLNPIFMTALTTGLALIPLALGGGEPGKEIQTPMAIVILGGLLTSTALNMIVVPSLFYKFGGTKSGAKELKKLSI
ncbi:efflux RND transporter permease subunit [candidate division KSB1 bacterium]|nr:efflux RND transporter permease subunit [candidate division KSB1 bacterium]NIR69611.1 efflux RND transporter permease subunit [candidate division KSB1 bacterium]NIS27456.1 efflux RND transporter permease subunit [candidate division KSB1 bacterium]NIT74308.1 efflux RND transporter permease subunit [candidate division KSB1 bacterium]NIU28170.1 efflux RND transporter permease subunit [candidate division KSB1 bacterium]